MRKQILSLLICVCLLLTFAPTTFAQEMEDQPMETEQAAAQPTDNEQIAEPAVEPAEQNTENEVPDEAALQDIQAEQQPAENQDVSNQGEAFVYEENQPEVLAYEPDASLFEITPDGVITGFIRYWGDPTDVIIPPVINGIPVRAIGGYAFSESEMTDEHFLTSITIPEGVVSIADDAFRDCTYLRQINLPQSLVNLGEYTFMGCDNLKSITIPGNVKLTNAFAKSGIENIILEPGITEIPERCFLKAYYLQNISIPDTVSYIGDRAFAECPLESINIPASVTYLGENVFASCDLLQWAYFMGDAPQGGTTIDDPEYNKYGFNPNYITLYNEGAQGFTNPWRGWPAQAVSGNNIIKGDLLGKGKPTLGSFAILGQYLLGTKTLNDAQLKAADMNDDGKVSTGDFALLGKKLLGNA